jgi:hypothetical protein
MNDDGESSAPSGKPIKRVGSMGDISVEANEKPSNEYTTRKSTLIGYVLFLMYLVPNNNNVSNP